MELLHMCHSCEHHGISQVVWKPQGSLSSWMHNIWAGDSNKSPEKAGHEVSSGAEERGWWGIAPGKQALPLEPSIQTGITWNIPPHLPAA